MQPDGALRFEFWNAFRRLQGGMFKHGEAGQTITPSDLPDPTSFYLYLPISRPELMTLLSTLNAVTSAEYAWLAAMASVISLTRSTLGSST